MLGSRMTSPCLNRATASRTSGGHGCSLSSTITKRLSSSQGFVPEDQGEFGWVRGLVVQLVLLKGKFVSCLQESSSLGPLEHNIVRTARQRSDVVGCQEVEAGGPTRTKPVPRLFRAKSINQRSYESMHLCQSPASRPPRRISVPVESG